MNNPSPEPPTIDYDDIALVEDPISDDYEYDPSFTDDLFSLNATDLFSDSGFRGTMPEMPAELDDEWSWSEARLVGVERQSNDGMQFEIGCMDVYTHLNTGDVGANYLPIASFSDLDVAVAFYEDLQRDIHEQSIATEGIPQFADDAARRFNLAPSEWRPAAPEDYAAYEALRESVAPNREDADSPPPVAIDELMQTAAAVSGAQLEADVAPRIEEPAAFQALSAIGIDAEGFDPAKDPAPFYDAETGTAYWIGVFQPDEADREHCMTSILSLGRNAESGDVEAKLAPCMPGDWDKTYGAAEYLIDIAQRNGIAHCFDAAEGMALATEQRDFWETSLGLPLEADAAQEIADYTRDRWEMDF